MKVLSQVIVLNLALVLGAFAQMNPVEANQQISELENPEFNQVLKPLPLNETQMLGNELVDPELPSLEPIGSEVNVEQENMDLAGSDRQLWKLRPFGSFGVTFDDNIYISNTDRQSDVIYGVEVGLAFELGDFRNRLENYLVAEYAGTGYFYTVHPQQNAFDQDAALSGQYRFDKLALQFESAYQYLTGPDRDVGNFVNRSLFKNVIRGIHEFSDKTSFDLEFEQSTSIYQTYLNQYDYRLKGGMDYLVTGHISLGLEGVMGILDVEDGPLQYYQQARFRARYQATGKLALKFSGGLEFREYEGDSQPVRLFPVFSLGFEYQPFDGTKFGLEAYCNSYGSTNFVGQNYVATGVSFSLEQRFLQKLFAGFAFGYENDTYYAVAQDVSANRVDNYLFTRPSLDYRFLEWLSAGVFYEFRNNASTQTDYTFYDNRVGFEMGVEF